MLYKFFVTQANQPCKVEWTEIVKKDLQQFNIPYYYFKSRSKDACKRIVIDEAKDFALDEFKTKEQQHTKTENVKLLELKCQTYFNVQNLRIEDMKNVFRF